MLLGLVEVDAAAQQRRLGAEDHALEHGEVLGEHEVLVHHADAEVDGVGRRGEVHLLAEQLHDTLVRRLHAVQDLHQRRFAGAVLAADGVDLALFDGEVDVIVGHDAREAFRDADQLDCSCQVPSKTQKRDRTVVRSRFPALLQMRCIKSELIRPWWDQSDHDLAADDVGLVCLELVRDVVDEATGCRVADAVDREVVAGRATLDVAVHLGLDDLEHSDVDTLDHRGEDVVLHRGIGGVVLVAVDADRPHLGARGVTRCREPRARRCGQSVSTATSTTLLIPVKDFILTSMLKHVDVAVFEIIKAQMDSNVKGGRPATTCRSTASVTPPPAASSTTSHRSSTHTRPTSSVARSSGPDGSNQGLISPADPVHLK